MRTLTLTCFLALFNKPCTAILFLKYFTTSLAASMHSLICKKTMYIIRCRGGADVLQNDRLMRCLGAG